MKENLYKDFLKEQIKIRDKEISCLELALEKISSYVTHLLDENMIASKYGQEILTMIVEVMKDEHNI